MSEPIKLSDTLNFTFDNPRTEKEIAYTKKFLTDQYDSRLIDVLPPRSKEDVITLELVLKSFQDAYSEKDIYIRNFFKGYKKKNLFDYFAKMWCVVRFDDEGEAERIEESYREMEERGETGIILLDDGHPILQNSEQLINYSHLLSLLSHTEGKDYFGRNFILDSKQLDERILLQDFTYHLVLLYSANRDYQRRPEYRDQLSWFLSWINGSKEILGSASLLEKAFKDGDRDKLLYIGNLLGIVNNTHDDKIKLLILTSIIELIVTRNPDTSRFNVEDSINKQFQLKAGALIFLNNKENDIDFLKKRLKTIYDQRSNIAHGNFGELENYKKKLSKKEGEEEYFQDLVVDLYSYVRAILEEYLKDPKFVKFIKAG